MEKTVNRVIDRGFLSKFGIQAGIATDPLQAVAASHRTAFVLMLMDLQMPRMDCLKSTRALRERTSRQPEIVGLAAHAFEEERAQGLSACMDDFLAKQLLIPTPLKILPAVR